MKQAGDMLTDVKTIADRMKEAREDRGMTQPALAKAAGVSAGTIGNIEAGTRKNPRELLEIAAALRVNPEWLKTGRGPRDAGKQSPELDLDDHHEYPQVRRVRFKLQAGVSGYAIEFVDDDGPPIVFRKDWFQLKGYRPEKLLAARVSGSSMEPSLFAGDLVVINTDQTDPRDGVTFAVNYEGELVIKRMVRDAGAWLLRSDNPDKIRFPDKRANGESAIIGMVVYKQSEII